MKTLLYCVTLSMLAVMLVSPAFAQGKKQNDEYDNFARKQQELQKRLENLGETIRALAENLAKKEPENAQKLLDAWRSIREKLILEDMQAVGEALKRGHLFGPFVKTGQIVEALIKIFEDIIDKRHKESRPDAEKVKENLSKIRWLIEWQEKLKKKTLDGEKNLAPEQGELKNETGELERELDSQKEKELRIRKAARLVGKADEQMGIAEKKLADEKPGAQDNQQKAIERLTEAEGLLAALLKELEYEDYYETVQDVLAELRKMLELQLAFNAKTLTLDGKKTRDELTRADRIEIRKMSFMEKRIAEKALELAKELEKRNSPLFAGALQEIARDLEEISVLLADSDTGAYTRKLQEEVVAQIKQLIAALEIPPEPPTPPGGGGDGGDGGDGPPPRPPLAELKLLRDMENGIHKKTKELNDAIKKSGSPNFVQKKMINRLAHRQARLTEMTRKLREVMRGK